MLPSTENFKAIEQVEERYVALFPVRVFGEAIKAETILAGQLIDPKKPGQMRIRATVETDYTAVPDLVALCDKIVEQTEGIESYRLLKFDKNGIHELDPTDFQDNNRISFDRYGASSWGS